MRSRGSLGRLAEKLAVLRASDACRERLPAGGVGLGARVGLLTRFFG